MSEVRFSHLLEPIRDLAKNWSIDIANELEEYLVELESITISFEDGKELNFAEAALLIQGSAVVYSKKIEHLYTLVYNTLNQVVEKKRTAAEATSLDANGADADTAAFEAEKEDDFLALDDDALKEVENITLPPAPAGGAAGAKGTRGFTLASAPLSLLPDGERDEGECKMHACAMHGSGALLLPHLSLPAHVLAALPSPSVVPRGSAYVAPPVAGDGGLGGGFDDDGDDGMPDYVDGDDGWAEAIGEAPPGAPTATDADEAWASAIGGSPRSPGAPATPTGEGEAAPPAAAPPFDPWAPLDPHDPSGASRRPFRKGKTYTAAPPLPTAATAADGVGDEGDEGAKENGRAANVLLRLGLLQSPSAAAAGASASPTSVMVPLRGPLWTQFESLHAAEAKRRAAARKVLRSAAAMRQHVAAAEADTAEVEAEAALPGMEDAGEYYDDNDAPGFDDGDGDGDAAPMGFEVDEDEGTQATQEPAMFGSRKSSGREAKGGRRSGSLSSYEEMCRAHVESFLEASSSYQEDLELYKRVAEWSNKVEPLLSEEAARAEFSIGEYSDRLLDNFEAGAVAHAKKVKRADGAAAESLPFGELAQAAEPYEVCRAFLAALQLTNQGNVELVTSGDVDKGTLNLTVNLLTREKRFERLGDEEGGLLADND